MVRRLPIKRLPTMALPQCWKRGALDICKIASASSFGEGYLSPPGTPATGMRSVTSVMCL